MLKNRIPGFTQSQFVMKNNHLATEVLLIEKSNYSIKMAIIIVFMECKVFQIREIIGLKVSVIFHLYAVLGTIVLEKFGIVPFFIII